MPKNYDYDLTGLQEVQQNLNREIDKIQNKSKQGVLEAGLLVERESKQKTPVDTNNLKAGTYTEPLITFKGPGAEIGYMAFYAIHVHERTELNHPTGEAKFLENALHENERNIIELIRDNVEVKG